MPKIDEAAKAWEMRVAGWVGEAVQRRRKALEWTGVQLAERTADLGYPITRVAISKIEGNSRAGKFDVAELLILAAALDIPPALLLAPSFPDGQVETRPGLSVDSRQAVKWIAGRGTELVEADAAAEETEDRVARVREMLASPDTTREQRKQLEGDRRYYHEVALSKLRDHLQREKAELWGERVSDSDE
jgi:transcriptional regulator with XRE-family HTH domain